MTLSIPPCRICGILITIFAGVVLVDPSRLAGQQGTPSYSVTDLGALAAAPSDNSTAYGLNRNGQVVGVSAGSMFVWQNGSMTALVDCKPGAYNATGGVAFGINDVGQIVGYWANVAFLYENGQCKMLGVLPLGASSTAYAINNKGQIVGQSQTNNNQFHGVLWQNGTFVDLSPSVAAGSQAVGLSINDLSQVLLDTGSSNVVGTALLWSNGATQSIPLGNYAPMLNSLGQVAGVTLSQSLALWQSNVTTDLKQQVSSALAINSMGQVIARTASGEIILWQNNSVVDLMSLLPQNSGWTTIDQICCFNDRGQISGSGYHLGKHRAFLMTPVGVPESIGQPIPTQPPPTVTVSPSSLSFRWNIGGPSPSATVKLTSSGAATAFSIDTQGAPWLAVTPTEGTLPADINISVATNGLAVGTYQKQITLNTPQAYTQSQIITVTLIVAPPVPDGTPNITAITNGGSGGPVSFNSLITIWGKNLSASSVAATTFPWGTTLGGTQVSFCDASSSINSFWLSKASQCATAQLTYVSPTQINAVLPDSPGSYSVPYVAAIKVVSAGLPDLGTVTNIPFTFTILPVAPGFFRMGYDCPYPINCSLTPTPTPSNSVARGSIIDQRGVLVSSQNPIRVGQIYSAYFTGAGLHVTWTPTGPVHTGNLVDTPPIAYIVNPATGNGEAGVALGIGASQYPGLYQINFSIPPDLRRIFTAGGVAVPSCQSVTSDISTELMFVVASPISGSTFDQVSIPVFIGKSELTCAN